MPPGPPENCDLRRASGTEANRAMARGVRAALLRNKLAGNSVVIWEDGQIVTVPADELVMPAEPDAAHNADAPVER